MKTLLNNALLHFVVIGVLLFFAYTYFLPVSQETIVVNQQTLDALIKADQELAQMELTEERKQSLIENFIDEEVLLREAYSRELYKNDYRVRKRLLALMRSSITDIIPEPSLAQLRAYYDENKDKFIVDESLSFETVRFSFNSENIPKDPQSFTQKLEASDDPIQYSEQTLYGNVSRRFGFEEVVMQYGRDMAEATNSASFNTWTGPVNSRNEVVYFRIIEQHEAYLPEFEKIESYLRDDYYFNTSRALQQEKIEALKARYEVTIEGD